IRRPVGFVEQFVDLRRLDGILVLELAQPHHRLGQAIRLPLLAALATIWVVELGHPDGLAVTRELAERPFRVFAIYVPDRNVPGNLVLLHADEGAGVTPSRRAHRLADRWIDLDHPIGKAFEHRADLLPAWAEIIERP